MPSILSQELFQKALQELKGKKLVYSDHRKTTGPQAIKVARTIEADPKDVNFKDLSQVLLDSFDIGSDTENMKHAIAYALIAKRLDDTFFKNEIIDNVTFNFI